MTPALASLRRLSDALRRTGGHLQAAAIDRRQSCSFCGGFIGSRVGRVDYWDLASCDVVQCRTCRQIQLDPMLTPSQMETGCIAFDLFQRRTQGRKWYIDNNRRHFRHGVRFGTRLDRLGIRPREVLEIGPGGGYFSRGLRQIYPDARVTVVDIVEEVLRENRTAHGNRTVRAFPEELVDKLSERYDLVVGRDILEHVADPFHVLRNCEAVMDKGGYLYILTPNGYEDVWRIHMNWWFENRAAPLLINHVNYFDAASLVEAMEGIGLRQVACFQTRWRGFMKGAGWLYSRKFVNGSNTTYRHGDELESPVAWSAPTVEEVLPERVRAREARRPALSFGSISIQRQIGHYISCLMQKP